MAKHIGIVACSAEGAALCYRTICEEGDRRLGNYHHPEITMHTHSLGEYMEFIDRDDWQGVAGLVLSSAGKLAKAGADFLICPDNTVHLAFATFAPKSPLPWLHIAEEVAAEAKRRGFRKLAITGTRYTMEGPVYPQKLAEVGIESLSPNEGERRRINEIIFEELVRGIFTGESTQRLSPHPQSHDGRWLRRGGAGLHRDTAAHRRHHQPAADARFDAHPGARGSTTRARYSGRREVCSCRVLRLRLAGSAASLRSG